MLQFYPCKGCGGERFEVVVEKHHELLLAEVEAEEETGRAFIDAGGDTVGEITCTTCGRLAATPDQLTGEEIYYLLEGTTTREAKR